MQINSGLDRSINKVEPNIRGGEIGIRWSGFRNWVFSLKNEKHQQFYSRLEDLTKKKDIDEKN